MSIDIRRHECEQQLGRMSEDGDISPADQIAAMRALCESLYHREVQYFLRDLLEQVQRVAGDMSQ